MNSYILDSSALLAFINQEPGHEIAAKYIPNSIMSSVNIAEVVAVLSLVGMPKDIIINIIADLDIEIISFDSIQAIETGFLRKETKNAGLSFGDRACINLAFLKNIPAVTADKAWDTADLAINLILIR